MEGGLGEKRGLGVKRGLGLGEQNLRVWIGVRVVAIS